MGKIDLDSLSFDTLAIHAGNCKKTNGCALATPIYQTSTFTFENADQAMGIFSGDIPGYIYSRVSNPTVKTFEDKIAKLEGGQAGVATSSGMGAICSTILALLKSGDHIVCANTLYGCTDETMRDILPSLGIKASFVDTQDVEAIHSAIQDNTKLIYFEACANPNMHVTDIASVAALKKKFPHLKIVVDNTFTPPPILFPLKLGADIVVHSVTKYINGHGDVVGGVVVGNAEDIELIRNPGVCKICGAPMSPFDAFLVIRGMKTLGLRVRKHCETALAVAQFLESSSFVEKVYYPGLESMGKDHDIAKKQMNGLYTAMISFVLKDGINGMSAFEAAKKLMNSMKLASIAVSVGDPDTLIQHPASMTHLVVPKEIQKSVGITDGMLRYSVGLEDPQDLIADFKQAFATLE